MKRRQFLGTLPVAAGGLLTAGNAFDSRAECSPELSASVSTVAEPCAQSRFRVLNQILDRDAMQRGWARGVAPGYHHAPQDAIEAFKDLKFGIRIHWGLYCLIGSHESWGLAGANRDFWNVYNVLYQFFNPTDFDADSWMNQFEQWGVKYFTFTAKHHDGFAMWPTKTLQASPRLTAQAFNEGCEHLETVKINYGIMDSPYKKDIVKAVVDAGRKKGMGVGLYYSHVDWHDPAFAWDPFNFHYDLKFNKESDPQRWQTFIAHEREQVTELLTNYGPIDVLDFDIGWPKSAAHDIADIAQMVRKLQPNIIMRDRGIGAYGDYGTPERVVPNGRPEGLWKVIYPCGTSFSYIPGDSYHPAEWLLETLIEVAAKGGNFEVGFGPMPNGTWAPEAVERMQYAGDWLRVNGEAIYATRPRNVLNEGKNVWFTASKDGRFVYAIRMGWPGDRFEVQSVCPVSGTPIRMLGVAQPLKWRQQGGVLTVDIPPEIAAHQPCRQAFVFRIQVRPA
jgi:alpha-L-fucosidase